MALAFYNDNNPFIESWLGDLMAAGLIAPGRIDRRSIADLAPADVVGPGQRHFFAGIGGWSHALRLAGVPDNTDIWTGSCPCQPFSDAGKGGGVLDARHLWPTWFSLIEQCRPPIIFGEQVASRDGLAWLDAVLADLERCGYAVGAADLCAASVGAPHQRQRLYFVAYADREPGRLLLRKRRPRPPGAKTSGCGEDSGMVNPDRERRQRPSPVRRQARHTTFWDGAEWILCRDPAGGDPVARPVEPGTFPLAHGVPGRVGLLSGYGNAIVPQVAAAFIRASLAALT